jgi:2-keto-3-deoxy-L-arabinonate dehydratase
MSIAGTYPMLLAFYDEKGELSRTAVRRQVEAALAVGASGIAVLGLGTEAAKLGRNERRMLVEWLITDVGGRLPVSVTIGDGNVPDMIDSARFAETAGAAWLVLQPPRPPASGRDLIRFFGTIAETVSIPVGVQNAPEYLGIGLSIEELVTLNRAHPNIVLVKAESAAVTVARLVEALEGRMAVFNGRAGLELVDNYRAGAVGMIPGFDTIDLQVKVEKAMRAGNEAEAEAAYVRLLPAVAFIMQTLPLYLTYGKLIAAHRLGLDPGPQRLPAEPPTPQGAVWAKRFAEVLGPLP